MLPRAMGTSGLLVVVVCCGMAQPPRAPLPPNTTASVSPQFVARTATGKVFNGAITRLNPDFSVAMDTGTVAAGELVTLRRQEVLLPPLPAESYVEFANGDRLTGEVLGIANDKVRFRARLSRDGGVLSIADVTIPLPALSLIWFRTPPVEMRHRLPTSWAAERRRRDLVLMQNGDLRRGTVKSLDEPLGSLTLLEDGKETRLVAGQVVAVALNTDLARTLRPRGTYGRLVLANGSRLSVLEPSVQALSLQAKTLFGANLQWRLEEIVSLEVLQGRAVFLSDLKPIQYEHQPYLGVQWPYVMDRSVVGQPLRLGGNVYDKGIGMHSQSRLTFNLEGQYRRFESWVGLDDVSGQGGRVMIRVLADDIPVGGDLGEVSSIHGPRFVEADITGKKKLTLVVEFGAAGDVCDHVNWCDARLVR